MPSDGKNETTNSQIFDPRMRSPIKAPEIKLCPTCGQPIAPDVKPITNHMNSYINPKTGTTFVVNSNENSLVMQGVTVYKVTGTNTEGKPVSKFVPIKTASAPAPAQQTNQTVQPK